MISAVFVCYCPRIVICQNILFTRYMLVDELILSSSEPTGYYSCRRRCFFLHLSRGLLSDTIENCLTYRIFLNTEVPFHNSYKFQLNSWIPCFGLPKCFRKVSDGEEVVSVLLLSDSAYGTC